MNDQSSGVRSVFNEAAPSSLMSSPSSGLVFARRKRSAFKGPMIHTANLFASSGMGTPGLPAGEQSSEGASNSMGRARARKSQIIEEEEDMEEEDIEEVDAFSPDPERDTSFDTARRSEEVSAILQEEKGKEPETSPTAVREAKDTKPVLAPAPDLDSSPVRPPRTSSLGAPKAADPDTVSPAASREGTPATSAGEDTKLPSSERA